MELILTRLIYRQYTQEHLDTKCTIDTLKDSRLEWNKEEHNLHRFKEDIEHSDIAFSVKDITNGEEFGYFFFKTDKATEGNMRYTLTKVVLDENLPTVYIHTKVKDVVGLLNNGEFLRKDRIVANEDYPLIKHTLEETSEKVADDVIRAFSARKSDGIVNIPPDMEEKLKKIAQKENAPE